MVFKFLLDSLLHSLNVHHECGNFKSTQMIQARRSTSKNLSQEKCALFSTTICWILNVSRDPGMRMFSAWRKKKGRSSLHIRPQSTAPPNASRSCSPGRWSGMPAETPRMRNTGRGQSQSQKCCMVSTIPFWVLYQDGDIIKLFSFVLSFYDNHVLLFNREKNFHKEMLKWEQRLAWDACLRIKLMVSIILVVMERRHLGMSET